MAEVGSASLAIIPSFKGFQSNLERGVDGPMDSAGRSGGTTFGDSAGRSAGSRFRSVFGTAAKATLVGVAGLGVGAFKLAKDSVGLASDLNESLNAVNVSYGKQAKAVKLLGEEAADGLGLSNEQFNSLSVRFSAFSKTIAGGDGKAVVTTLDDLTTRAADFASVMNLEVNEAAELFQSGLAGETEPLRRYGLDLSAAAVQAHAWSKGIAESGEELTEQEKIQARYSLLMKQTNQAAGDFANTSDSLANRQRILSARWDNARATLGTALLPIMEDVAGFLLDEGIPAFEKFGDWFTDEGMDGLKKFGTFTRDEVLPVVKDLAGFLGDAASVGADVVKFVNDLPDAAKLAGLAAVVGGVGAAKFRGGKGAVGGVGAALGLAKGTPVYVTNWAQIAGADGVAGGGKGNKGLLGLLGFAGGAGIAAGAGTVGIHKLSGAVAPAQTAAGNFGSPQGMGQGLANAEGDLLDFSRGVQAETSKAADYMSTTARKALADTARAFAEADIPSTLKTDIALNGVPESMRMARDLVRQYDLTPKEKRTLFELAGFDTAMQRLKRIDAELDWVARPREARITITKAYADAGYETRGGLQSGAGTNYTNDRRSAIGGYP